MLSSYISLLTLFFILTGLFNERRTVCNATILSQQYSVKRGCKPFAGTYSILLDQNSHQNLWGSDFKFTFTLVTYLLASKFTSHQLTSKVEWRFSLIFSHQCWKLFKRFPWIFCKKKHPKSDILKLWLCCSSWETLFETRYSKWHVCLLLEMFIVSRHKSGLITICSHTIVSLNNRLLKRSSLGTYSFLNVLQACKTMSVFGCLNRRVASLNTSVASYNKTILTSRDQNCVSREGSNLLLSGTVDHVSGTIAVYVG